MEIYHVLTAALLHTILASAIRQECSDTGTTTAITTNLTCESYLEIYADGRLVGTGDNFSAAYSYVINPGADVIALKCQVKTPQGKGGILGSFGNGLVTDSSWKCTAEFEFGWNTANYADEHWPYAVSHEDNRGLSLPWGVRENVLPNATWIWTQDSTDDVTIYCRHKLVEKCSEAKSSFFHTEPEHTDRSLDGFVVKTTHAASEMECGMKCGQLKECVSFNVQYTSEKAPKICELNRAKRNTAQLVERRGFQFYEVARIFY